MIYELYCPKCKKKTLQEVFRISRKRGIKTFCLTCGYVNKWHKINSKIKRIPEIQRNNKKLKKCDYPGCNELAESYVGTKMYCRKHFYEMKKRK